MFKEHCFKLAIFAAALSLAACDDSTDNIGASLSETTDHIDVVAQSFNVQSRSIAVDSVLSRSQRGYLGKVRDPETGAYITSDFMAQFYCKENYELPTRDSIAIVNAEGRVVPRVIQADSCVLRLYYDELYGDPSQTMKLTAYEMGRPMNEDRYYYSNFDPMAEGYVRRDGLQADKVYSLTDYNIAASTRDTSTFRPFITVRLNKPYTDKDGHTYNNFGTYMMQKYYDNPANYKDAFTFRNNVVPGFYFKSKSGLGSMAYIDMPQLTVYFKMWGTAHDSTSTGRVVTRDTIFNAAAVFWGTEEVLQSTHITNDRQTTAQLVADTSCTYLKTPAGVFTELTIPVEEIKRGHENDTIATARLTVQRINNETNNSYAFSSPKNVLLIPKDSLKTFFLNHDIYDNRTSFMASLSANGYTFNNISSMVAAMAARPVASRSADWNKVVMVPIETTTTSTSGSEYSSGYAELYAYYYGGTASSTNSTTVTKIGNDMSLTSTRLVRGTATDSPIQLSVIYSRSR